jgi:hypothetical protein
VAQQRAPASLGHDREKDDKRSGGIEQAST